METFELLANGFVTALQPTNLLFAFLGCFLGTFIGLLPGIGPSAAIAVLIPLTFTIDPTPGIIMLAAIYYGAMYGGTISSVLINTPGDPATAVTCLEGYEMAKQGRAGAVLTVAAIGSFIGGTLSTFGLVLVALPLVRLALKFGPPEFFALIVMSMCLVAALAGRSLVRAMISAAFGLLIAIVGLEPYLGTPRFTFGLEGLLDGVALIPAIMGLFGVSEILLNVEKGARQVYTTKVKSMVVSLRDLKASIMPIVRGTGIGFFFGVVPGVGAIIPTFLSYVAEKKFSKTPEKFGTGMIEGVAGPETANNACSNAAFIPLFTLGIPGSGTTAVLIGAFIMHGLTPGPLLFQQHSDFVWTIIASLYIGNVILVILNVPLIPVWVAALKIPYSLLFALILALIAVGSYSLTSSVFTIGVTLAFGILGYVFRKLDIPLAPLVMTLILAPLMERGLRQSLEMSAGDFSIFVTRPISAAFLAVAVVVLANAAFGILRRLQAVRAASSDDDS